MKKYLKNNVETIAFSVFIVLFIYSVRIFNYNIGVDTEEYLFNARNINLSQILPNGAWGSVLLRCFFDSIYLRLNIFSANLLACSFLVGSCLLWLALFRHYSHNKNIFAELAFCLFYMSSKVWVEIIYFTMMASSVMFAVLLSPICSYLLTEGIIRKNNLYFWAGIFLFVSIISVYQPMVVLVFSGLLAVYILRNEFYIGTSRNFWMIIVATITSLILYFTINFILLNIFSKGELSKYVTNQIGGGRSVRNSAIMLGVYIYSLFFANNPLLNTIIDPIIVSLSQNPLVSSFAGNGASLVEHFHSRGLHGCTLFFPAVILFLLFVFKNSKIKNKALYRFSALLFLGCAVVMAVAAGGVPAERHLHALPLITAFLFFYTLSKINKPKYKHLWFAMILIFGFYQSQNSSLLNVSDYKRYVMDIELAKMINNEVQNKIGYSSENRELIVFGNYDFQYGHSYLKGEVIGKSVIFWGGYFKPDRPAKFMYEHGYRYIPLEYENNIGELIEYAKKMPIYPNDGWVSEYKNIILVKFSETSD